MFSLKFFKYFGTDYDFLKNDYDCNVLHPLRLEDTFKKKDRDHVFSKVAQTAEQLPLTLNTLHYALHFRSIKEARRCEGSCNFLKNLRLHIVIDIFSRPEYAADKNIIVDILIFARDILPRFCT